MTNNEHLLTIPFNNKLWRKILSDCLYTLQKQCGYSFSSVISPFGFELTGNINFLNKHLRRFYCYLGTNEKSEISKVELEKQYSDILLEKLRDMKTSMSDDFALIITGKNNINRLRGEDYQCATNDKLLDIELRHTASDVITDYGDYIITCVNMFIPKEADLKHFETSLNSRSRLYQLYIMVENLYSDYLPAYSSKEHSDYLFLVSKVTNDFQEFYTGSLITHPTEEEKRVVEQLVEPRIKLIQEFIFNKTKNSQKIRQINCKAYHGDTMTKLDICENLYKILQEKVKASYLAFS